MGDGVVGVGDGMVWWGGSEITLDLLLRNHQDEAALCVEGTR